MAASTFSLIFVSITSYFVYRVLQSIISNRRFASFAQQHGCKDPYDLTGPLPFYSLRRMIWLVRSDKLNLDILDDIAAGDYEYATTIKAVFFDGTRVLGTIDPENIQAMLATQFSDFITGPMRYNGFKPLLGRSIFTSDGAFWEHSRALFRPQFARDNINDLDATSHACEQFIDALGQSDTNGWTAPTNAMPLLYNFTLDTATDFLFGETVDSQAASTAERMGHAATKGKAQIDPKRAEASKRFAASFDAVNQKLVGRLNFGALYWISDGFEFRRALRTIFDFTEHFVQLAIKSSRESKEGSGTEASSDKKTSLMRNLATQTHNGVELRNQTLSILLAGRDTTAGLLGWSLVRLALHPEILATLRTAILTTLPADEPITFSSLKSCRYLQHFLSEVLRLHPILPVNNRIAAKDTTLPVGGGPDRKSPIAVRKGQLVVFSTYELQRRKDLWGEDALQFRPERWEERRVVPAWHFIPFLGGPRTCLGQQFALTEAAYLLCCLLREYDAIEPVDRALTARLRKSFGVTMWPRDAKLRFRKAKV